MRVNSVSAYLLLGSNVGFRERYLAQARSGLRRWPGTQLRHVSRLWSSEPWGLRDQREFINQAVEIETRLAPLALLIWAKKTEIELGRRLARRWGPRKIDMDILLYGREIFRHPFLAIPHPGLSARPFALGPLAEIAPNAIHPVQRRSIAELWGALNGQ